MTGILGWIIFGFIVGLIARAVMPGRDTMGFVATTLLGIIGAVAAGWAGSALGWYQPNSGAGLIASMVGAIVVLGIYNAFTRRKGPPSSIDRHDRFAA